MKTIFSLFTVPVTYLSELSLSIRSREPVDAAPGDELNNDSDAFTVSDSDVWESILFDLRRTSIKINSKFEILFSKTRKFT